MEEKGIKVKEIADGLSALNAMNVMVMSAKKAYELKDDPEVKEDLENMVLSLAKKIGCREGDMVYVGGGKSYGALVLHTEDKNRLPYTCWLSKIAVKRSSRRSLKLLWTL